MVRRVEVRSSVAGSSWHFSLRCFGIHSGACCRGPFRLESCLSYWCLISTHPRPHLTSHIGCWCPSPSLAVPLGGWPSNSRIAPGTNHWLIAPIVLRQHGQLGRRRAQAAGGSRLCRQKPSFCQRPEKKKRLRCSVCKKGKRLPRPRPCVTTSPNRLQPGRANNGCCSRLHPRRSMLASSLTMLRLWLLSVRSAGRHGFQLAV